MRSVAWHRAWWACFGAKYQPYILVARQRDAIGGILPLAMGSDLLSGRRLILSGSVKACGDDLGLLTGQNEAAAVSQAMVEWLEKAHGRDTWDSLDLDGLQPANPSTAAFMQELKQQSALWVEERHSPACWAVDLSRGWTPLLSQLSKRARKIVKSVETDYLQTGRARLREAESLEDAQAKLKKIIDLHQSRWQERQIAGCFSIPGFQAFIENLLHQWWPERLAYVATLELDGREVAGAFGFWNADELALYLVGMDIDASEHRPGWIFNIATMQHALANGRQRVNFLRGDEEYKARLGSQPIEQLRWVVTSPRFSSRCRRSAIRRGLEVRDWFRSPPSRSPAETSAD
jgi:hypothetical protein